jgi:hypothetical protein
VERGPRTLGGLLAALGRGMRDRRTGMFWRLWHTHSPTNASTDQPIHGVGLALCTVTVGGPHGARRRHAGQMIATEAEALVGLCRPA